MLPYEFTPWQTVYFYFCKWKSDGIFEELMHNLSSIVRKAYGKEESPSIGLIDSRSVRTLAISNSKEYVIDGGKKLKGRKQHIVVDTLGLPVVVKVHPANIHDSVGAIDTIGLMRYNFHRMKKIIADGGY